MATNSASAAAITVGRTHRGTTACLLALAVLRRERDRVDFHAYFRATRRSHSQAQCYNTGVFLSFNMHALKKLIREVPDFPKPGILFYDITTLLKDPGGLRDVMAALRDAVADVEFDVVAGIESRGFVFGPSVAQEFGKGFVPVRKPGKLPAQTEQVEYELEYGTDSLEIHKDAVSAGTRVLIVDDLLATGGTAKAVAELVEKLGGKVAAMAFVVELDFLNGRGKLVGYQVRSLLHYDS